MHSSIADLLAAAREGDGDAWDAIVEQFENLVWSVVRSFHMSEADSLDAAQLTWLRLVESLENIREPERLGAWLVTTARRECLRGVERVRRAAPQDPVEGFRHLPDPRDGGFGTVERSDELSKIVSAFETLSQKCRSLLRVALADPPPSYEEISLALDLPVGTIGPRRQRCLAQLRAAAQLAV